MHQLGCCFKKVPLVLIELISIFAYMQNIGCMQQSPTSFTKCQLQICFFFWSRR